MGHEKAFGLVSATGQPPSLAAPTTERGLTDLIKGGALAMPTRQAAVNAKRVSIPASFEGCGGRSG